jgi:molybdate transport system permease protein
MNISFSSTAVIMAQLFMAAPFFVTAARQAFEAVDDELISVSRTLGIAPWRTFWKVTFPLALSGLLTGVALAWARALGEFGATMMFAGNLPGKTQTLPLAIYTAMESDSSVAVAISALLLFVAFALLLSVVFIGKRKVVK